MHTLTPQLASHFATIALGHVEREYPNGLQHAMAGPEPAITPRGLHPVFFGSYDWHSCVHGYWLLARLLRAVPDLPEAAAIRALFARRLTPEAVAGEVAYFDRPNARGYERPYGWAWVLKLASDLPAPDAAVLRPLTDTMVARFLDFLPRLTYPIRTGTHFNSAFAVTLALDSAPPDLTGLIGRRAKDWFDGDRDCQAWEPGGDEFLSSALTEALCMSRVMPADAFRGWFAAFLPRLASGEPATLFQPVTVSDRSDGKIAHLDGTNLSRAWCLRRLAAVLPEMADTLLPVVDAHIAASLPHVAGDYMGEHWLATFALLALEAGPTG